MLLGLSYVVMYLCLGAALVAVLYWPWRRHWRENDNFGWYYTITVAGLGIIGMVMQVIGLANAAD